MTERRQPASQALCAVADHLDSILAASEDLLALHDREGNSELVRLELVAITHALQARQRLGELEFSDQLLAAQAAQFLARTTALESKQSTAQAPPGAAGRISQAYLIGRAVSIAALTACASALLDALEDVFVLYEDESGEPRPPVQRAA
jgi:hypothetical protein